MYRRCIFRIVIIFLSSSLGFADTATDPLLKEDKIALLKIILPIDTFRLMQAQQQSSRMQIAFVATQLGGDAMMRGLGLETSLICGGGLAAGIYRFVTIVDAAIFMQRLKDPLEPGQMFRLGLCYRWCDQPEVHRKIYMIRELDLTYASKNSYRDKIKDELGEGGMHELLDKIENRISIDQLWDIIKRHRQNEKTPYSNNLIESIEDLSNIEVQIRQFVAPLAFRDQLFQHARS